uniref:DDE Tnp4 domain-containing protein n=1 Tax=Pelodiscus sinensis TaxID=13735 RepID=K7GDH3_PELSI
MQKSTFQELCAWLAPALQCQDTHLRPAISLEKRVAIALWKLATLDSYCSVGHQFGMGRSTVGAVLMEVVMAINAELLHRTVRLRDLHTILALDRTHIPIRTPPHQAAQYIKRKGYFLMVLQGLVDQWGQFTDICVGWSGRAHNAHIFQNSYLYHRLQAGAFFPERNYAVGDVQMPTCIVANAAYPLMPWLMKPLTGHLDASRELFNSHLNRARFQMECAFGRLKGRFRCLLTWLDMAEHNIPHVVAACCVLHNLVERKGEAFLPAWGTRVDVEGRHFEQCRFHTPASTLRAISFSLRMKK